MQDEWGARGRITSPERLTAILLALLCGWLVQLPHLWSLRAHENLDWTVHYNYAREYVAAMQAGDLWPRWAFQAQHGLGEPGLLYYAPLYYMGSAQAFRLTGNVWLAMQLVEVLAAGVLGYFAWALARAYAGRGWALLACVLAVLSPMFCLLHLGFNGYPWACALAPVAMLQWAVLRPEAQGRLVNVPAIFALALTVLTHTVTGLMAVIMLGALPLAGLAGGWRGVLGRKAFWSPAFIAIPGLLLAGAYLYPAFASQNLINSVVWRQDYTPFSAFSLSTVTAWAFGMRWFAFQWPVSLLALGLAGLSIFALRKAAVSPAERGFLCSALLIAGTVLMLSTELSYPLWLVNSPLRNVQFPHRFISLLIPLAAVLTAVAVARSQDRRLRLLLALGMLASLGVACSVIAKAALVDGKPLAIAERGFPAYDGLTEYRTAQSLGAPQAGHFDFGQECVRAGAACSTGQRQGRGMDWVFDARAPSDLRLPVYCFPAWAVTVNGGAVPQACDAASGLVRIALPQGRSRVNLKWTTLPEERAGLWLSLLGAVLTLLLAIGSRFYRQGEAGRADQ